MVSRRFAHLSLLATSIHWTQPNRAVSGCHVERSNRSRPLWGEIFLEQVVAFATIIRGPVCSSHLHPHEGISLLQGDRGEDQCPCAPDSLVISYLPSEK